MTQNELHICDLSARSSEMQLVLSAGVLKHEIMVGEGTPKGPVEVQTEGASERFLLGITRDPNSPLLWWFRL